MGIDELLKEKREEVLRIAAKHGACNVRIFGSVARGEAGPESDVDLLVDIGSTHSSWFPAGLVLELEELLGLKVEVITEASVYPPLKQRILEEAVLL